MKVTTQLALTSSGLLLLGSAAVAQTPPENFVGVEMVNFTDFFMNDHPNESVRAAYANAELNTWRVYAVFTAAAQVYAHGGKAVAGAYAWSSSSDGAFWNFEQSTYHGDFNYDIAPTSAEINANPSHAFDTFGTIGTFVNPGPVKMYNYDQFVNQTNHMANNWVATDSGWFTANPEHPQMVASQTQEGLEYDGLYRVSVMQISVAAGQLIYGNLGILGGMDSNGEVFEIWDGAPGGPLYYGMVPAPSAALLLGLLGFARTRRRHV